MKGKKGRKRRGRKERGGEERSKRQIETKKWKKHIGKINGFSCLLSLSGEKIT